MDFRTVTVTTITKDSKSGIITFSTPISANPERNGIAFACKPTDYIGLDDQRQYIEVSNGYRGIKFSVHNEITITGDPASPYAEVGEDYTSEDYKDKIEDIFQYLVTSIMVDCPCDVSVFGGPVGGVSTGGNTAGTTGTVASQIVYVGGNNITLSQSITGQSATITISGPNTSPSLSVGVSTGGNTSGDTALVTGRFVLAGGNNVTLSGSTNGGSMTVTVSAGAGGGGAVISAGTQTGNSTGTILFQNSNGITFGMSDSSVVTASHNGLTAQSNQTLGMYAINNTILTSSTTIDARSVSIAGAGNVSVGYSAGSVVVSGPDVGTTAKVNAFNNTVEASSYTINLTNWNFYGYGIASVGLLTTGGSTGVIISATQHSNAASATNGSFTFQTLKFVNSFNVSFSTTADGIVASVAASNGIGVGISTQGNTSGTTGFVTASSYQLVGSYDIGLSQSTDGTGATVTIQRHVVSTYMRPMEAGIGSISAIVAGTASVVPAAIPFNVTGTNLDLVISNAITTAGNNSTAGINYSVTAVLHTRSGNTLFSIASTTNTFGVTWTSNNTGRVTGAVYMPMPLNLNLSAGYYFLAAQIATANTGGIITGANTTQLNNTVAMMGVPTGVFSAMSFREIGNATDESNGFFQGQGIYSSTGNLTEISMSAISNVGTRGQRANIAFRIRG